MIFISFLALEIGFILRDISIFEECMSQPKKILIVSYYFPPLNRVASSRVNHWGRYLENSGFEVEVYTTKKTELDGPLNLGESTPRRVIQHESWFLVFLWPLLRVHVLARVGARMARWYWVLRVPFSRFWIDSDLVITSYGPKETIVIGFLIKLLNPAKKWLIDYRDLWTLNPYTKSTTLSKVFEKIMVSKADYLTTVSAPLAEQLRSQFPDKKVSIIYNGFDKEVLPCSSVQFPADKKLRIVHAGTIYPVFRDPEPLLAAVAKLISNNIVEREHCELVFLGDRLGELDAQAQRYHVADILFTPGQVSRDTSLQFQTHANALVLLSSDGPESKGIVTGKVFEYITSKVPILGIGFGEDSCASEVLVKTGTGRALGKNVELIYESLVEIVTHGKPNWFQPNGTVIDSFSRDRQAESLVDIIEHHL